MLRWQEEPSYPQAVMVLAIGGWADAGESATRALRYAIKKLSAQRFADIDPEEFYDFTQARPMVTVRPDGERTLRWPANEFFHWAGEEKGFIFFLGVEPHLRWKTFSRLVAEVARRTGVDLVVGMGALLDAIPHTLEPRVSGTCTREDLRRMMEMMGITFSGYQGPTGIHSAIYQACRSEGLHWLSLWGHAPHYIQGLPNPKVSYALLRRLTALLSLPLDLSDLKDAVSYFEGELTRFLDRNPELRAYVRQLEERYSEVVIRPHEEIPTPQELLKELEEFLRRQREQGPPSP